MEQAHPPRGHGQRFHRVEAPLPIIHWKTVPKEGHLEMLDHGVHHLPEGQSEETAVRGDTVQDELSTQNKPVQPPSPVQVPSQPPSSASPYSLPVQRALPVDSAGTSIRIDVHLIEVDINLWDFHLEAVGKELDGFPNSAIARSPWQRKKGLGFSYNHTGQNVNKKASDISSCNIKVLKSTKPTAVWS